MVACMTIMRTVLGWDKPGKVNARVHVYHHVSVHVDLKHCNHRHDAAYS